MLFLMSLQEPNGQSFSLKKTSICRGEFHAQPYSQRGDGYTLRVAAALRWLLGTYGDSPGDVAADFGALLGQDRNRFFRDYDRAASWFHSEGSVPGIATWVRDWTGDGQNVLTVKTRRISTFLLLLKFKGVESAVWPWLFPVPELCDSALAENEDADSTVRWSLRFSFLLKLRSSVSAYAMEHRLAFFLFDVFRARSFYSHCIVARRKGIDVACTVRNEAMSEQYWLRERDVCADLVRQMHDRSARPVDERHRDVYNHCLRSPDPELLAFPNVFVTLTFAEWKFPCPAWMRPHLASQPEGSGLQTLHIYEVVVGVLDRLLSLGGHNLWRRVVEHLRRVEFQGRGTLHFHVALWVLHDSLDDLVHSTKGSRKSVLGSYLEEVFECDVDIQVGSGFLNYINGYVTKASDCVDFSSKEYSDQDDSGAENTDWKRTYRGLLKGTPCLQEIYCSMSSEVKPMARSVSVEEAFPPVPFEPPRSNQTSIAYDAFFRPCNRGPGPLVSFISWLRSVKSISPSGVVRHRALDECTLALAVRYRGISGDGFLGQLCTMLLPHAGPEAFCGGLGGSFMLPHLQVCRCLVGALAYLGSLRFDVGGLRSDFYPDVLLDLQDFPRCSPLIDFRVSVGSYVFGHGSLAERAFSTDSEDYLLRVVAQHLRFSGCNEDRVRTQRFRLLSAFFLSRKVVAASGPELASLQHRWDTVVRGRSFAHAPAWSPDQVVFFRFIHQQLDVDCVWDLDANVAKRRCFLSGPPGTGKSELLVHAAKLVVDRGCRVLFLAPTGALVHSYLDRLPDSESIFVDTVHAALRFSRESDTRQAKFNPPSRLQLYDVIFLDEVSMLSLEVFEALLRHIQELPQRPIFVVAGDFAQLKAMDGNQVVRLCCEMFETQFHLTTVHRSKDPKHLGFVSRIREAQPSRQQIEEYFDHGKSSSRFLTIDRSLDEWVQFGMDQQELHGHPFVWICNTNKGVATVSLAALRNLGIFDKDIHGHGFAGDPSVKGSLPILPRPGVWIRLTRNLDKGRGFVNGALGQVHEVFRHEAVAESVFSLRLISGTMLMVHPVCYQRQIFLPCVYGYGCTVRRTQGLSLWHGAVFLDGNVYPRPRGHGYVAVSRFRRANGVFHYGPLRRSDWLPTAVCDDEQDRPGELSPRDWDSESDASEDEYHGGLGGGFDSASESEGAFPGAEDESSEEEGCMGDAAMARPLSSSESVCSDDGHEMSFALRCASPVPAPVLESLDAGDSEHEGSDRCSRESADEHLPDSMACVLSASEEEPSAVDVGHPSPLRGASLSATPVLVGREDSPPAADALRVDAALESAEEEVPRAVDPALSDSSSECSRPVSAEHGVDACSLRPAASPGAAAAVPDASPCFRSGGSALPPRLRLGAGLPSDDAVFGAPPSRSPRAKRARGPASQASPPATSAASPTHREIELPDGGLVYEHVHPVTCRVTRTS